MAVRGRAALIPRLYTAQEVARFCEVDLKTVHHWADRGKVPHFRTEGRHLRFRRNDLVRFFRAHGYPMPEVVARARPSIAVAPIAGVPVAFDELTRKLSARFSARRFASGLAAFAHVLSDQPDAVVMAHDDPTLAGLLSIAALRGEAPWVMVAVVIPDEGFEAAREAGAEVLVAPRDAARLPQELGRALASTS